MKHSLAKILLIYTGGTIGMIKDSETGALRAFDFNNLLLRIPELKLLDCEIETFSFDDPIDSSNMTPKHWVAIAEVIESNYNDFDGFVILHGSDTMSYSASALSFMFDNLTKPVILTGSQLPIGDLRTDAKENLITSIQIASLKKDGVSVIQEVGLYFEYKLYRGNRTTKINAEHFEAFSSLNYPEIVESGVHLKVNERYLLKGDINKPLVVEKNLEANIVIIKIHPCLSEQVLKAMLSTPGTKGVILETYGAGNCFTDDWFITLLRNTVERGVAIVNVTQCSGGSVAMGKYETSQALTNIGVISGLDMTTEAALAKLMYLLPLKQSMKQLKKDFEIALRGELT